MTQDHRAADEHPEQAQPSQTRATAGTDCASARVGQVGPINPRFDYRLKTMPHADTPAQAPGRDLGRCLAEMRATMLELGYLIRPGKDQLHS